MPFCPSLVEGSLAKIGYSKKGTLIPTSLLEDLVTKKNGCPLFHTEKLA